MLDKEAKTYAIASSFNNWLQNPNDLKDWMKIEKNEKGELCVDKKKSPDLWNEITKSDASFVIMSF